VNLPESAPAKRLIARINPYGHRVLQVHDRLKSVVDDLERGDSAGAAPPNFPFVGTIDPGYGGHDLCQVRGSQQYSLCTAISIPERLLSE